MNKKLTIIIEDIGAGKEKGLLATIVEFNNSIVMGENFKELFDGLIAFTECVKEDKIDIFSRKPLKTVKSVSKITKKKQLLKSH